MLVICYIILVLIVISPLVYRAITRSGDDIFDPLNIVVGMTLLNLVYLAFVVADENIMSEPIRQRLPNIDEALIRYCVLQAIGFIALIAGIRSKLADRIALALPQVELSISPARCTLAVIAALILSLSSFALFLVSIGGYQELLYNLQKRASLMAGSGYLLSLLTLLLFAVMVSLYSIRLRPSFFKFVQTSALILMGAAVYSFLGGRKSTLHLIIISLLTWHYGVRRIRRITWQAPALLLLIFPYFVIMPILRKPGAIEEYSYAPERLVGDAFDGIGDALNQISYVDNYVFVFNEFGVENMWWGKSYLDLLAAPIPSSVYPEKPPVDDGVYVRSMVEGIAVEPGMSFKDLYPSSLPPETMGALFMNFWIPGLILGMFALGIVNKVAYAHMKRGAYTPFGVYLYAMTMLNFQFSNLRLVQYGLSVTIALMFFGFFFGIGSRSVSAPTPWIPLVPDAARAGH